MHITNLPNDIALQITHQINNIAAFTLATACKKLYEQIRHLPLNRRYKLNSNSPVGSFFHTNTRKVDLFLRVNDINYQQIQDNIDKFYYLDALSIISDMPLSVSIATSLLSCIPCFTSTQLLLEVSQESIHSFDKAIKRCRRNDINVTRNQQLVRHPARKRMRTPSPIRDAELGVKKMKEWWLTKQIYVQQDEAIPVVLREKNIISKDKNYIEFEEKSCAVDMSVASSKEVDGIVKDTLAPLFLESYIKFGSIYVFLTQFEVYFRNNTDIDASSIATLQEPYHDIPVAVIKDKNERGKTWYEVSIYLKKYELLITGGIVGEFNSTQLNPFLGPSVPFISMSSSQKKTSTSIIILETEATFVLTERNLRNWAKPSSSYKWAVKSRRFAQKGFTTVDPLRINSNKNQSANLISFALKCISEDKFATTEYKTMMTLLAELPIVKEVMKNKIKNVDQVRREIAKHRPTHDFLRVFDVLLQLENNTNKIPRHVIKAEATVALFAKLYPYCRTVNKMALNFYKL